MSRATYAELLPVLRERYGRQARSRMFEVEAALPFLLLGFDSDNGGEFLNCHLWRYFSERAAPVNFTRSWPCHKNETPTSSRRTGATRGSSSATSGWKSKPCSRPSMRSTPRCGTRCKTSSAPRCHCLEKSGKAAVPANATPRRKPRAHGCSPGRI